MNNIIEVHLDFIDKEIDKYRMRFNYDPVLICNQDTRNTMIAHIKSNTPMSRSSNTNSTDVDMYCGCHILIDNTMQFGMIDIR